MNEHLQLPAPAPGNVSATTNNRGKVPAPKTGNFLADFRALTDRLDEQIKRVEELRRLCLEERRKFVQLSGKSADVNHVRNLWEEAKDGARGCLVAVRQQWSAIEIINGLDAILYPPIGYFKLRISQMLKKFPDEKMFSTMEMAQQYGIGLAEWLQAEDLNIMALESIFRDVERDAEKPPTISQVLPFVRRHKNKWQERMDAIKIEDIQRLGEELVFALEFKNAVFKEAVLEYLDAHGCADLIDGVRSGKLDLHFTAIHTSAKIENMTELVAELETPLSRPELLKKGREIASGDRRTEWELRMLNARWRLNRGKSFACQRCGAGYDNPVRCQVCGEGDVVGIELWDERAGRERQSFENKLEERRLQLEREQLQLQHEQPRRDRVKDQRWEQFTEVRYEKRRRRRIRQNEDMKWDKIAEEHEVELELQQKMERAQEEHWEAIASEDDPLLDADAEIVEAFRYARRLSDEEFAELQRKAKREARAELIERARRVMEEQRDELMRNLDMRLAEVEGWKSDGTIGGDYSDVIDDLKDRVTYLKRGGEN